MNEQLSGYKEQTEIKVEFLELFKLNEELKRNEIMPELTENISLEEMKECEDFAKKQNVIMGEYVELSYNGRTFWFCDWKKGGSYFVFVDENNLPQEYVFSLNGQYEKNNSGDGFSKMSDDNFFMIKNGFNKEMRRRNKKRPSMKLVPEN